MKKTKSTFLVLISVLLFWSQASSATWIELAFEGTLYGQRSGELEPYGVELTLVYAPSRANTDIDPDPNMGFYQGDFAVGAALVVNGITEFFCGTVDGFGSHGTCLPMPGLTLTIEKFADFDLVSFGYFDPCPYGPSVASCQSILQDSVSGSELWLANILWHMDGFLVGDSIYQLPGPPTGSDDSRYVGSGFNIILLREGPDAVWDTFEEGPWDLSSVRYVPEPGTLALLGIGLLGICATRRKKT